MKIKDEGQQASAAVDVAIIKATVILAWFDDCMSAGSAASRAGSPAGQPGS